MRHKHGQKNTQPAADASALVQAVRGRVPETKRIFHHSDAGTSVQEEVTLHLRTRPIAWAIPCDEIVFTRFFTNFVNLRPMPWDDFLTTSNTYISEARNTLHQNFLEHSTREWLFMLDSDVLPPPDVVERLLAHKLPMVGGWYRKKGDPYPPCVYDFVRDGPDGVSWWQGRKEAGTGLERVDGAGAGCWLMRRDVAEALGKRPYDPHLMSEDFVLCRKLAALNIPVHIDWSIACAHAGVAYT